MDFAPGKRACPSSGLLVPFGEEAANAFGDMTIDGPVGRSAGSVAEIGRPARKSAVQSVAHFRPRSLFARLQKITDLVLDALHAFLGRTRARVLLSALGGVLRSQRVAEEVEAFRPRVLQRGFGLVEGELQLGHRGPRPRQR